MTPKFCYALFPNAIYQRVKVYLCYILTNHMESEAENMYTKFKSGVK